jgi:predicted amidophosphoribosyltransferase
MSLPDYLLDEEDDRYCPHCDSLIERHWAVCDRCRRELADMYADEKISEGRRR